MAQDLVEESPDRVESPPLSKIPKITNSEDKYCEVTLSCTAQGISHFFSIATSPPVYDPQGSTVLVTLLMEDLFEEVTVKRTRAVWIEGPPGSGKTVSLYWLYRQLQRAPGFHPVACSTYMLSNFDETNIVEDDATQLVLLVDAMNPKHGESDFFSWLSQVPTKFPHLVIAISSGFSAYAGIQKGSTKPLLHLKCSSKVCPSKAFDEDLAARYISSIRKDGNLVTTAEEVHTAAEKTNLLPRLLWVEYWCRPEDLHQAIHDGFRSVLVSIAQNFLMTSVESEIKLLLACRQGIPVSSYGISTRELKTLYFIKTCIVECDTENDVPRCHLPLDEEILKLVNRSLWRPFASTWNVDSQFALGNAFENAAHTKILPSIVVMIKSLDKRKKQPEEVQKELTFTNSCNQCPKLTTPTQLTQNKNLLYRTKESYAGVDYVSVCAMGDDTNVLVGIQVTIQLGGKDSKIQGSISKMPKELTDLKDVSSVYFIVVNPRWDDDRAEMFDIARSWTARNRMYQSWSFGIPKDSTNFVALYSELCIAFNN